MFAESSAIEPKGELIQVTLEVPPFDSPVVGSSQPSLEIPSHLVHPGQNTAGSLACPLDSEFVAQSQGFPVPVFVKGHGVRADLAAGQDVGRYKSPYQIPGEGWQTFHPDSASMVPAIFHRNHNRLFGPSQPSGNALLDASDVDIVQLDGPVQRFAPRIDRGPAQASAHVKSAAVRAYPQLLLELESGYPRSKSAHEMSRPEPGLQREVAPVHDSACCDPHHLPAFPTTEPPEPHLPTFSMPAMGAFESIRPPDLDQVITASPLGVESSLKLPQSAGEERIPL